MIAAVAVSHVLSCGLTNEIKSELCFFRHLRCPLKALLLCLLCFIAGDRKVSS